MNIKQAIEFHEKEIEKLKELRAHDILFRWKSGQWYQKEIANLYGLSEIHVRRIIKWERATLKAYEQANRDTIKKSI